MMQRDLTQFAQSLSVLISDASARSTWRHFWIYFDICTRTEQQQTNIGYGKYYTLFTQISVLLRT